MAHEIVFDTHRNINPIAFTGETPWHGLGQQLPVDAPIEVWARAAGMDFTVKESNVGYLTPGSQGRTRHNYPGYKALYRDDTNAPLGLVGHRYNVVQPAEVLDFFRSLTEAGGFKMNTAGVLFGGTKFWALADIGAEARILGDDGDKVNGFLLLATSCDGSMATTAMFTSVRVVCNNTLNFSVRDGESGKARRYLKVPHSRTFNPDEVKGELGLAHDSFSNFIESANVMAKRRVKDKEAMEWLLRVFGELEDDQEATPEQIDLVQAKHVQSCYKLFKGEGLGSSLKTSEGTVWGLLNGVTEHIDLRRNTRTADSRLNNSWFGEYATIKNRAWEQALKMVA